MPVGRSGEDSPPKITLLYLVKAGTHDVVVVVDPDNNIVESNEDNNIMSVPGGEMGSNWGALDLGVEVVAQYSVPAIILGATIIFDWGKERLHCMFWAMCFCLFIFWCHDTKTCRNSQHQYKIGS